MVFRPLQERVLVVGLPEINVRAALLQGGSQNTGLEATPEAGFLGAG